MPLSKFVFLFKNFDFCDMGRKPINKQRLDNPKVRAQWVEQLMPLYMEHGLRNQTMDEVSQKLGVSKATVYKHFSTRGEIVSEVVERKIAEITDFKQYLIDEDVPFQERYLHAIKMATIQLAGISNQFLSDLKQLYPKQWDNFSNMFDTAVTIVQSFYEEGIKQDVFNDINPKFLAISDKMFISALANPKFLMDNNLTLQQAVEDYFTMKSQGIFKK